MHEGGIVGGVLEVVMEAAAGDPVKRVQLRVGTEQGVVKDSFDLHWEILTTDTNAAGAVVEMESIPGGQIVVAEIELEDGEVLRNPQVAHTH